MFTYRELLESSIDLVTLYTHFYINIIFMTYIFACSIALSVLFILLSKYHLCLSFIYWKKTKDILLKVYYIYDTAADAPPNLDKLRTSFKNLILTTDIYSCLMIRLLTHHQCKRTIQYSHYRWTVLVIFLILLHIYCYQDRKKKKKEFYESVMNTYSQTLRYLRFAQQVGFGNQFLESIEFSEDFHRQNARTSKSNSLRTLKYLLYWTKNDNYINISLFCYKWSWSHCWNLEKCR